MSRLFKYQIDIIKFLKINSFINNLNPVNKKIIEDILNHTDHIPAILCLTILNNQCKKFGIKVNGYHLAVGIDLLMLIVEICNNLDYHYSKYGTDAINNIINEITNYFYACIVQSIESLKEDVGKENVHPKITQLCIDYSSKLIALILQKKSLHSSIKMKKNDILCLGLSDNDYNKYKMKNNIAKKIINDDIITRYGSICKLAMNLGWIIGQYDNSCFDKLTALIDHPIICKIEFSSDCIGKMLKLYSDFKNIDRDINYGYSSLNYIVNHGVKEAYIEIIEAKATFLEETAYLGIDTKTNKEIVDTIINNIDNIVKDVSVDMNTQYDDVSTI